VKSEKINEVKAEIIKNKNKNKIFFFKNNDEKNNSFASKSSISIKKTRKMKNDKTNNDIVIGIDTTDVEL
jgi:hypothetical protein